MILERAFRMNFEEFQTNRDSTSLAHWSLGKWKNLSESGKSSAKKAQDFVTQCYALHEAFALSLRSLKASAAIKEQLMSMVRERKQLTHARKEAAVALTTAGRK